MSVSTDEAALPELEALREFEASSAKILNGCSQSESTLTRQPTEPDAIDNNGQFREHGDHGRKA